MMVACEGDEMSQELETYIPGVDASPDVEETEAADGTSTNIDADYLRGTYNVEVTGSCQRPGHARQTYLGATRADKIYTQVEITEAADGLYKIAIEGFRTVAWDYPFDIEVECKAVEAMYDGEEYYALESTEFSIDLNAACAYKQTGNTVSATIEAKIFMDRMELRLSTELSWSPKDAPETSYTGYADMTMSCSYATKTANTLGNWTFGTAQESTWFELPSDDNIGTGYIESGTTTAGVALSEMEGEYYDPGMLVDVQGALLDPVPTTIYVDKKSSNTLTIALYDFSIEQDGDEIVVGDIKADCDAEYNEAVGGYDVSGTTTVYISSLGLEVHPSLSGTITKGALDLVIDIEVMAGFNVQVTFKGERQTK